MAKNSDHNKKSRQVNEQRDLKADTREQQLRAAGAQATGWMKDIFESKELNMILGAARLRLLKVMDMYVPFYLAGAADEIRIPVSNQYAKGSQDVLSRAGIQVETRTLDDSHEYLVIDPASLAQFVRDFDGQFKTLSGKLEQLRAKMGVTHMDGMGLKGGKDCVETSGRNFPHFLNEIDEWRMDREAQWERAYAIERRAAAIGTETARRGIKPRERGERNGGPGVLER